MRVLPMPIVDADRDAFIVRISQERRDDEAEAAVWWGDVEHLATREMRHFRDMATLVEFLIERAGLRSGHE